MLTYNGKALKVGSNNVWLKMPDAPSVYEYCVDFAGSGTSSFYVYNLIALKGVYAISPTDVASFKVVNGVETALSGNPCSVESAYGLSLTAGDNIFRIYLKFSEPIDTLTAILKGTKMIAISGTATLYEARNQTIVRTLKTATVRWMRSATQQPTSWTDV